MIVKVISGPRHRPRAKIYTMDELRHVYFTHFPPRSWQYGYFPKPQLPQNNALITYSLNL